MVFKIKNKFTIDKFLDVLMNILHKKRAVDGVVYLHIKFVVKHQYIFIRVFFCYLLPFNLYLRTKPKFLIH